MDAYYDDGNNNDNDVDDDDEYDLEDLTAVSSPSVVRVYQPILYGTPSTLRTGSSTGNSHYNNNYSNNNTSNTGSFIGGAHSDTAETCAICQSVLFPLVNYYHYHSDAAVEDCDYEYTILRVSACNRPSCYRTLFPNVEEITKSDESVTVSASSIATTTPSLTVVRNALHYGGNGVVVARRIPVHRHSNDNNNNDTPSQQQPTSKATSGGNEWTADIDDLTSTSVNAATSDRNIDQNDDKDENDGDLDFDALESQLNAIEARGASLLSPVKPLNKTYQRNHRNNNPSTGTRTSSRPPEPLNGFPKFMLHGRPEPPVVHSTAIQQDMDDVGLSGRNNNKNDQKKIQQMLQQYMEQMEDDVDLLNLLQQQQQQQHPIGNTNTGGSRHNNNHHSIQNHTERDERLSVMDRALFTYTDRLKRVPRQVVRYGGTAPLWSIPIVSLKQQQQQHPSKYASKQIKAGRPVPTKKKNKPNEIVGYEQPIPTCRTCGTRLRFELQLLSSILHVLNVDGVASPEDNAAATTGGMDWGNISVYTCPNPRTKCSSNDAFCIVQDSIDQIHYHLPNLAKNSRSTGSSGDQTMTTLANDNNSLSTPSLVQSTHDDGVSAGAVVIPEHSQFDPDDDDDGIVLEGDEYDNDECDDDDDSVW